MKRFFWISIILATIVGCKGPVKNVTDKAGNSIETGKIVNNQHSSTDTNTNYCYYLPQAYNGSDKLPIIFFLDPHANGSEPIKKYADLANKYKYILVASNNVKNGMPGNISMSEFQQMIQEAQHRFVFDEKRMFTAGFSGGAKLAMVFAQQLPEIIGVAACGGSIPMNQNDKPGFYYVGIVGNQDFNYLETNQTFSLYDQNGFDFTSVIFDGDHMWPPKESFEMAFIGFNIYAIKLKRADKDKTWLDEVWEKMNDSIASFDKRGDLVNENIYLKQTTRWFHGLRNIQDLTKRSYEIEQNRAFLNIAKKRQKLIQTEVVLRSEYIKAIETQDLTWWKNEVQRINESITQNDKAVANVSSRLLNYLSMAGFMLVKTDLMDSRLDDAIKKIKIYEMVDPDNPDVYLMYAHYYMQQDDTENMKLYFNKALDNGFKDFVTYKNDSFWSELMRRNPAV